MSRSAGSQTTTTTSEPPSYLLPYLQMGARGAAGQYAAGGTPSIGPSSETQQAMDFTRNRALMGSPLTGAAQDFAIKTLGGGYLDGGGQSPVSGPSYGQMDAPKFGESNPYLDATFNQAARGVTNQVQSNFARSGRRARGADAAGIAADRYSDLAADIYGGAFENERSRQYGLYDAERNRELSKYGTDLSLYNNERQRMQQTLPLIGSLANLDYMDFGQLANVGAQREAYQRDAAGQPGRTLDEFLARLQGFPGGTVTQATPMERNILGSALGGAQLGSMFGPWGLLGGAVLGGVYG